MSAFLPTCRRWPNSASLSYRAFSTAPALRAYQRATQPAKAASPTTPSSSATSAPKAAPAQPLQSSHAQGGSASSQTSPPTSPPEPSLPDASATDWSTSFSGLGSQRFDQRTIDILLSPIDPFDVEIKPDGIIYLPEIKYRRVLNKAFGPGGWGLAPRGPEKIEGKTLSREYALVAMGQYVPVTVSKKGESVWRSDMDPPFHRLVAVAKGEQDFFDPSGAPTASEGCKSNALMRCCKDLGIASELW